MALKGLVILQCVFQATERKLISYNMLYEVTQMMDSGPHPDCTRFPNVDSHAVHFLLSWQRAAADPGCGGGTHCLAGQADPVQDPVKFLGEFNYPSHVLGYPLRK